ncbi:MAG: selenocysteine-specific translation elongation factor [Myxococcota bacterium]|jgi:selenocysteine-specific elongation factor|nr:selenocysteine-specific translation elongation factor [Myxococcota bacterium]
MILGTAGHIDHGKTSLVRALTGINTDRLKEEQERGITIELGFAHFELDGERIGVVDVPGHERFVRHMVAGAAGIDVVMMIIAADEGVMPQTREHLEICQLMGVRRGFVVLTKTDLVDEDWLMLVEDELRAELSSSFLGESPIIPFSAMQPQSTELVRAQLLLELQAFRQRKRRQELLPRLPIDRVFSMKGFGTVVTGTLLGGSLKLGDELELVPEPRAKTRIRKLSVHGEDVERVGPGTRVAINLQGLSKDEVHRGQLVSLPGQLRESLCFDAELTVLEHVENGLADRASVLLHTLTQYLPARVVLLEGELLLPGETGLVQLRCESPCTVLAGDRFVLRGFEKLGKHGQTVAGGRVLDPLAPRFRRKYYAHHLSRLRAFAGNDAEAALAFRAKDAGVRGVERDRLSALLPFSTEAVQRALQVLEKRAELLSLDDFPALRFSAVALAERGQALCDELAAHHQSAPLELGLSKELIRSRHFSELEPRLFESVLGHWLREGAIRRNGEFLHLSSFMPPRDDELDAKLLAAFESAGLAGFAVESLDKVLRREPSAIKASAKRLFDAGKLIRAKPDFVLAQSALLVLHQQLLAHFEQESELNMAQLKDLTGLTRKHLIPLVEYLDRRAWTRRQGDLRLRGTGLGLGV